MLVDIWQSPHNVKYVHTEIHSVNSSTMVSMKLHRVQTNTVEKGATEKLQI